MRSNLLVIWVIHMICFILKNMHKIRLEILASAVLRSGISSNLKIKLVLVDLGRIFIYLFIYLLIIIIYKF